MSSKIIKYIFIAGCIFTVLFCASFYVIYIKCNIFHSKENFAALRGSKLSKITNDPWRYAYTGMSKIEWKIIQHGPHRFVPDILCIIPKSYEKIFDQEKDVIKQYVTLHDGKYYDIYSINTPKGWIIIWENIRDINTKY